MFDEFDMVLDFDGLSLADLFAEADAIGDKYLSDDEIEMVCSLKLRKCSASALSSWLHPLIARGLFFC
jgi:hypothetical protein